jgi:peptide-methionine (R)-S-oxide reductase
MAILPFCPLLALTIFIGFCMNRRNAILHFATLAFGIAMSTSFKSAPSFTPLTKTKAEWKKLLPPAAYTVLFEESTERAGSSPLNDEKRNGTYICAACNLPLFTKAQKFDSGTG